MLHVLGIVGLFIGGQTIRTKKIVSVSTKEKGVDRIENEKRIEPCYAVRRRTENLLPRFVLAWIAAEQYGSARSSASLLDALLRPPLTATGVSGRV